MLDEILLETAFRRIEETRMRDVPILNPALAVEAVAFRDWCGMRVGVLITPWTINLVILREAVAALPPLALHERRRWEFPSGSYEFMGGEAPECGRFDFCSLFSPPEEFTDQAGARAAAAEVMTQLFAAGPEDTTAARPRLTRRALFVPQAP